MIKSFLYFFVEKSLQKRYNKVIMDKRYFIETFGCQMNVHDSEKIAGMLRDLGYVEGTKKEEADIIVFNTCCIRETAETKIMAKIGDTKALKRANPNLLIVVCGCMTQQNGMADVLKKRFPFLSLVIGTHNLEEMEEYIKEQNKKFRSIVWDNEKAIREDIKMYRTSDDNAWVNIMYGCNNFCTYCIVPYVRGRERSRKIEDIAREVESLVKENKYKMITLLGQNVNSYGNDFKDGTNFVTLLNALCKIDGNFKISFMSSHPKDFSFELIDFIANHQDKMSINLHLPAQSGSDEVLRRMNRRYTSSHYKELVDYIYKKIPNATLSTDIIVGFPGETEKDFEDTLDLIRYCKFASIFGFVYSKRQGTPAATFDDQVPQKTKKERITRLFDLEHALQKETLKDFVGKIFDATITLGDKGNKLAKTHFNKLIRIEENDIEVGKEVKVFVEKVENDLLYGKIVK